MHEVHHLDSLRALYGGAYEVATIDGGVCVKVQDVVYIQWFAQIAEEGLTLQVSRIFRYAYWNDLLIVRTVRFRDGLQATADDGDTYTVIPTLFRALTNEDVREAPAPSLGAPITSHQITFRAPNGEVYTVTRTDFQNAVAAADFEAYAGIRLREIELAGLRHQVELHIADTFLAEASELVEGLIRSLR